MRVIFVTKDTLQKIEPLNNYPLVLKVRKIKNIDYIRTQEQWGAPMCDYVPPSKIQPWEFRAVALYDIVSQNLSSGNHIRSLL